MKDELAERLLAKVLGWDTVQVTRELPILQDMARYKYDEYQQFKTGERFIESLALWLRQFRPKERATAYAFVRERLVFISSAEMRRLVAEAFPTIVRPRLLALAAETGDLPPIKLKAIAGSSLYKTFLRRTLFLGLSDGAHTDLFRRNNPEISNEQIWHAYDYSDAKARSLGSELVRDLEKHLGRKPTAEEAKFRLICLLDDFTASGKTYLRPNKEGTGYEGKVATILKRLRDPEGALSAFLDIDRLEAMIVIYVAAAQAADRLQLELPKLATSKERLELKVVHRLPAELQLIDPRDSAMLSLAKQDLYFDKQAETEATKVGGEDVRLGFANGRLPVVLSHNTPNNSLYLMWAEPWHNVRGLFPRVSRHRDYG